MIALFRVVNGPTRSGPNPARTQKYFKVVNGPVKARKFVWYKCKITFNFSFINPLFQSTAVQI